MRWSQGDRDPSFGAEDGDSTLLCCCYTPAKSRPADGSRNGHRSGSPLPAVHEARAADPGGGALGGAVVVAVVGEAEVPDLLALVGAAVATGSSDPAEANGTDSLVGGVPHLGLGRNCCSHHQRGGEQQAGE